MHDAPATPIPDDVAPPPRPAVASLQPMAASTSKLSISALTAQIKAKLKGGKNPVDASEENEDDTDAEKSTASDAIIFKKPSGPHSKNTKHVTTTIQNKLASLNAKGATSKIGKTKPGNTTALKKKTAGNGLKKMHGSGALDFCGTKNVGPRHHGECTIYTDVVTHLWRVKPGKGRRDHKKFSFTEFPQLQWKELVKYAKSKPL